MACVFACVFAANAGAVDGRPPSDKSDQPRGKALKRAKTALVEFATSPFPYDGVVPGRNTPFLDASEGGRKGHRMASGWILWEDAAYRERRVLLHIPAGYDVTRPGVMVVFLHGHRATLGRDVRNRQKVPAQVSAAGVNAVLVAPQLAFNAPDSSAGKFWRAGACGRFVAEAESKLAKLHGDPSAATAFASMPVVLVAYSGGYLAAAWCLHVGGIDQRLRGVVLLDALYGELEKYAAWIAKNPTKFFVSAYTKSTQNKNLALKAMLAQRGIASGGALGQDKWKRGVTFLASNSKTRHEDFVTQAWVKNPLKDILRRLDEYRR